MEQVRDKDGGHPQLFTPHVDGDGVNIFCLFLMVYSWGKGSIKMCGWFEVIPPIR